MSLSTCRIVLVDHEVHRSAWQASMPPAAAGPATNLLTALDARSFAAWNVAPRAVVFQVGAASYTLAEVLPTLLNLSSCKHRVCYRRDQTDLLVILEVRDGGARDVPVLRGELEVFARPTPRSDLPATGRPGNGAAAKPSGVTPRLAAAHLAALKISAAARGESALLPAGVRTLVLVEDDMMVRTICTRILQPHFLLFETDNPNDALALADELPVPLHVLVTDVNLPGMDGVSLARDFRQRRPQTRVLLLSGNPPQPGVCCADIGYLPKPFLADDLIRAATNLGPACAQAIRAN